MLHSLMKIAVIQNNASWWIGLRQSQLITKNQLKSRIASEIALHLYTAIYWRIDDISRWIKEDIDLFIDVNKNLIGVVFTHRNRWSCWVDCTGCEEVKIVAYFFEINHTTRLILYYLTSD